LPANLSESDLRRNLLTSDLELVDGGIPLPEQPGLGIEIDRDALSRFAVD